MPASRSSRAAATTLRTTPALNRAGLPVWGAIPLTLVDLPDSIETGELDAEGDDGAVPRIGRCER